MIYIDRILSDSLMLGAALMVAASFLVFLIALVMFVKSAPSRSVSVGFSAEDLGIKTSNDVAPIVAEVEPVAGKPEQKAPEPALLPASPEANPVAAAIPTTPEPPRTEKPPAATPASDKTIVMPPGWGEIQGQIELVFNQVRLLNKKVATVEAEMETLARTASAHLDVNELNEPVANAGDLAQKLLKLAEHVILLEKEVARLKSGSKPAAMPPAAARPPIMPL